MTDTPPLVLVVEDDPLILLHSRLALEDAGFTVVVASDSDQALETIGARDDIAMLFTDVRIPGAIDGLALARSVRRARPDMAIFVTSGACRIADDALPSGARFLSKPYTGAQVTQMMRAGV